MQLCDSDVSVNFKIYIGLFPASLLIILFSQMKEFFEGSGVYWYSSQRSICSACTKWEEYVNTVVDVFFSKEVLKMSFARGKKKEKKLENTVPLCQPIVDAIIGKYFLKYFC